MKKQVIVQHLRNQNVTVSKDGKEIVIGGLYVYNLQTAEKTKIKELSALDKVKTLSDYLRTIKNPALFCDKRKTVWRTKCQRAFSNKEITDIRKLFGEGIVTIGNVPSTTKRYYYHNFLVLTGVIRTKISASKTKIQAK